MENSIKLQADSIFQVPLHIYENDFIFIVNNERFETSSIIASLLSPTISSQLLVDPTARYFSINTKARGDFKSVLNLVNFKSTPVTKSDLSFMIEVLDQLGTEKVDIRQLSSNAKSELTLDNIFDELKIHNNYRHFFRSQLESEVEFVAENFSPMKAKLSEFAESKGNEIIIESIIGHTNLKLESEDELLDFVNQLYVNNHEYSFLYKYVDFVFASLTSIGEFIRIFDFNDLTSESWNSITERLNRKIEKDQGSEKSKEKHKTASISRGIKFEPKEKQFDGIIRYLKGQGNIKDELNITASSSTGCEIYNVLEYDNPSLYFETKDMPNSWICFEFKKHQIIPSNYIIRTINSEDNDHLKSWILEGSNDKSSWHTLDERKNDSSLKGKSRVHLFSISNQQDNQPIKYIRIRQTGPNWYQNNDQWHNLLIGCIEFYGNLI